MLLLLVPAATGELLKKQTRKKRAKIRKIRTERGRGRAEFRVTSTFQVREKIGKLGRNRRVGGEAEGKETR